MATIKDVAKLAGVSVATVSRVLNKKGPLSETAITRVNDAVQKLNYSPNLLARSLACGRNNTIGVILPSFNMPICCELAQAIETCAREQGYKVLYTVASNSEKRCEAVEYMRNIQVDGVIFCGSIWGDTRLREQFRRMKQFPIVVVIDQAEGIPCVVSDDMQGGIFAARHLIGKGCKNVVHVSSDLSIYKHADERTYAFLKECEKQNICCRMYENHSIMSSMEEAQDLADRIFAEFPEVDGMFLKNDILAAGFISYALAKGIHIPDDIRIVGFDDMYLGSLVYPQLTSIRHNYKQLAESALKKIQDQIDGKSVEELTIVPVELVERASS